MSSLESWGFLSLISCMLLVTLSMTVVTGGWAISWELQRFAYPMGTARSCKQAEAEKLFVPDCYANRCIAVVVGILSSGLYAASAQQRR